MTEPSAARISVLSAAVCVFNERNGIIKVR
jgi:hypothetical protein